MSENELGVLALLLINVAGVIWGVVLGVLIGRR